MFCPFACGSVHVLWSPSYCKSVACRPASHRSRDKARRRREERATHYKESRTHGQSLATRPIQRKIVPKTYPSTHPRNHSLKSFPSYSARSERGGSRSRSARSGHQNTRDGRDRWREDSKGADGSAKLDGIIPSLISLRISRKQPVARAQRQLKLLLRRHRSRKRRRQMDDMNRLGDLILKHWRTHRPGSVSYTHLDVYKRQI